MPTDHTTGKPRDRSHTEDELLRFKAAWDALPVSEQQAREAAGLAPLSGYHRSVLAGVAIGGEVAAPRCSDQLRDLVEAGLVRVFVGYEITDAGRKAHGWDLADNDAR